MSEFKSAVSCAFCGRTGGVGFPAGKLVAGAKGVAICRDCLEAVTQVMNDGDGPAVRTDDPTADS